MATYYVRTDGNDTNAGTGPATNQAWQTITKALGAAGIGSGDTLYIAPGVYRGNFVINASAFSVATYIIGDVTASQFSGIPAGSVRLSSRSSDTAAYSGTTLTGTSKPFLNISNIYFDGRVSLDECNNLLIEKCLFYGINEAFAVCNIGNATGATTRNIFRRNIVISPGNSPTNTGFVTTERVANQGTTISDCYFITNTFGAYVSPTVSNVDVRLFNCTFSGYALGAHFRVPGNYPGSATVQNCLFINGSSAAGVMTSGTLGNYTENFNRILMPGTTRTNVATGANSVTTLGWDGVEYGQALLMGYDYLQMYTALAGSPNIDFGTSTNAPTSDIYGVTWTGTTPTAGATAYRSLNGIGFYNPTERNASTITIAPGSTSQSIELYLGVTGLTASTSGLSAYYNRTRSADVQIPLVARTIGQAWTSGGFAEVNPNTMPGVYRLDLPNAAVAAGADDVTVVVRGASGTNGAVMTIKLSSGGLTAAQTASAILDAVGASYVTAGSIGYAIQNSNVASISGSTAAADELEGALLHNGTDYISAQLIAGGGGGAGDVGGNIINLNEDPEVVVQTSAWVGDWHTYVLRLVDSNGTPYDITNDTLAVTFTNVATGSAYAFGGGSAIITKQMNGQGILSILNPAAYPSAAVIRLTVSATIGSDVRRFGPLEIEVLAP